MYAPTVNAGFTKISNLGQNINLDFHGLRNPIKLHRAALAKRFFVYTRLQEFRMSMRY